MRTLITAAVTLVALSSATVAGSGWDVRRASMSANCSLQPSGSLPTLGVLLVQKPNKKEACEAAASLKTDDVTDASKCAEYTPNTILLCKEAGVVLP